MRRTWPRYMLSPRCWAESWTTQQCSRERCSAPLPLSPKTHPQGRAPEHLLCSFTCGNQVPPAEQLLPLRLLPKHARATQNRIPLTTHQNHTNSVTSHIPMGTSRPALTCLIQQLVKRRAGTTGGLSTTTALLGSVYFNPSTCKLQHFWSGHTTLLAISAQEAAPTAWEPASSFSSALSDTRGNTPSLPSSAQPFRIIPHIVWLKSQFRSSCCIRIAQSLPQLCCGSDKHGHNDCNESMEDCISKDEQLMRCANSFLGLSSLSIHKDWASILDLQNFKDHFTYTKDFVYRQNTHIYINEVRWGSIA